jgi:hypothetical protein
MHYGFSRFYRTAPVSLLGQSWKMTSPVTWFDRETLIWSTNTSLATSGGYATFLRIDLINLFKEISLSSTRLESGNDKRRHYRADTRIVSGVDALQSKNGTSSAAVNPKVFFKNVKNRKAFFQPLCVSSIILSQRISLSLSLSVYNGTTLKSSMRLSVN